MLTVCGLWKRNSIKLLYEVDIFLAMTSSFGSLASYTE